LRKKRALFGNGGDESMSPVFFGKPVSIYRVKPEGMLFRDML
jgi:hypothetical protein